MCTAVAVADLAYVDDGRVAHAVRPAAWPGTASGSGNWPAPGRGKEKSRLPQNGLSSGAALVETCWHYPGDARRAPTVSKWTTPGQLLQGLATGAFRADLDLVRSCAQKIDADQKAPSPPAARSGGRFTSVPWSRGITPARFDCDQRQLEPGTG